MDTLIASIVAAAEFPKGSRQPRLIAEDWIEEGFSVEEAIGWMREGLFSAFEAKQLSEQGLQPHMLGLSVEI